MSAWKTTIIYTTFKHFFPIFSSQWKDNIWSGMSSNIICWQIYTLYNVIMLKDSTAWILYPSLTYNRCIILYIYYYTIDVSVLHNNIVTLQKCSLLTKTLHWNSEIKISIFDLLIWWLCNISRFSKWSWTFMTNCRLYDILDQLHLTSSGSSNLCIMWVCLTIFMAILCLLIISHSLI